MTKRQEPINVAAAAAAAAVVSPARPQAEVHRTEHFAPEVPAALPEVRGVQAEPESSSFETAVFEHAPAANEGLGYIRELEQHEFDQEDDRTATRSMAVSRGQVAPATDSYAPSLDLPRLRFRFGRVIFVGLVSGLLVAVGLLAAEGIWARHRYPDPSRVSLRELQFAQLNFAVEVPLAWDVETAAENVSFTDPDRPDDRGLRVARLAESLEEVRSDINGTNRARFSGHRELRSSDEERVAGFPAIIREFIGNEVQYRQWTVDDGRGGSFVVESWFHPAEADETQVLDQRIIESFNVL